MKEFLKSKKFKGLLMILFLLIGLTIGAARAGVLGDFSNGVFSVIMSPIKNASSHITGAATKLFEQFTMAEAYYNENQELKKENQQLREDLVELGKYRTENQTLRDIAGLKEINQEHIYEPAMVIARDPLDKFYSFKINKGSIEGVKIGDPVISAQGLIGSVVEVNPWEATVKTVLHPDVQITVYSYQSLSTGYTKGELILAQEGKTRVLGISNESTIAPGDTIVTAGAGMVPRETVLGIVETVEWAASGLTKTAVITTTVDIIHVKEVIVITKFEGQMSQEELGIAPIVPKKEEPVVEESIAPPASAAPSAPPASSTQPEQSEEETSSGRDRIIRDEGSGLSPADENPWSQNDSGG